jgi:NAD(P)-dependent dehydrogenase (short-subunit alcohol dehydrogenase family)
MMNVQSVFADDHPVALVTGSAAPRVGRVVADRLTELGCRVVLHAHSEEQALRAQAADQHQRLVLFGAIEEERDVQRMAESMEKHYGRWDILVNCAAIWKPKPFEQVTASDVRQYFDVNSLGTFLLSQAAGLRMVQQSHGGAIVNLGDWAVVRPYLDHAAYFPSKGLIPTMTRSLAVELGSRNPKVRVNALLPGPVLLGENVSDDMRAALIRSTLVRQIGTPEHIAHAVQFLVENSFVTGICLPVDGGRQIYADEPTQTELRTG